MRATIALAVLLGLPAMDVATENSGTVSLDVSAEYTCLSPQLCDSVVVYIRATNWHRERVVGCFLTTLGWKYEPSDSLRAAFVTRIDSIEAAGGHVCRWHPVSFRLGEDIPGATFGCREVSLGAGESFIDTLAVATGAQTFVDYPGVLNAEVTIWWGTAGSTWRSAAAAGSCSLAIKVPGR